MDELISDAQAEWLMAIGCSLLFVAALAARLLGGRRFVGWAGPRTAVMLIILGPLLYALWRVDALLIDLLGFDRLLRLAVEAAAAIILGVGLGLWIRSDQGSGTKDEGPSPNG